MTRLGEAAPGAEILFGPGQQMPLAEAQATQRFRAKRPAKKTCTTKRTAPSA